MIEQLIARGGWDIDDPRPIQEANPDSFWLPPASEVAKLKAGTQVRLIFAVLDQANQVRNKTPGYDETGAPNLVVTRERMWLWVEEVHEAELVGVLTNMPFSTHTRLVPGARVRFPREFVIDLDLEPEVPMGEDLEVMADLGFPVLAQEATLEPEDPTRAPTLPESMAEVCRRVGARAERAWPFARCMVGRTVSDDIRPLYILRGTPLPERGDCGWMVWATHLDMKDADEADGFDVIDIQTLQNRCPTAFKYLALPPGWVVELRADGSEEIYEDPEMLDE